MSRRTTPDEVTPRKKYILLPGFVYSRFDDQRHYIGAPMLARLYRVPMDECLIVEDESDTRGINVSDFILLTPDTFGKYEVPTPSGA